MSDGFRVVLGRVVEIILDCMEGLTFKLGHTGRVFGILNEKRTTKILEEK